MLSSDSISIESSDVVSGDGGAGTTVVPRNIHLPGVTVSHRPQCLCYMALTTPTHLRILTPTAFLPLIT
jgi:hypothetical protein